MTTAALTLLLAVQTQPKNIVLAQSPTAPVEMVVGQKLVFEVTGNASTGGSWVVTTPGTPGLKFLGSKAEKATPDEPGKPPKVGQSSKMRFTFQAMRTGDYNVGMNYGRSWEIKKGGKPWDTRSARVTIK